MYKILLFRGRRATLKTENSESENLLLAIWKNAEQAVAYKTNKENEAELQSTNFRARLSRQIRRYPLSHPLQILFYLQKKQQKKMQRMMQPHPVIKNLIHEAIGHRFDSRSNRARDPRCVSCVFLSSSSFSSGLVFLFISQPWRPRGDHPAPLRVTRYFLPRDSYAVMSV